MESTSALETHSPSKIQFQLAWVGLNALGLGLAYIFSSIQFFQLLAGALFPNISQVAANWVYLVLVTFSAVLIAVAQWFVLRGWLKEAHWWLAATALGWTFVFLISSKEVITFENAISSQDRALASFMFLISFAVRGLVVGLPQWLALRLEHPHTRAWIGWSTLGTTVSTAIVFAPLTLLSTLPSPSQTVIQLLTIMNQPNLLQLGILGLLQGAIAAAVSSIWLGKVYTRPTGRREAEAQANPWRRFLLYWSLATLLGLFINYEFSPTFLSNVITSQSDPTLRSLVTGVFSGVVLGILQYLVLREHYKNAILWVLVTALGFAFTAFNQQLLSALYPDTAFLGLHSFGDVLRSITYFLAGGIGFWLVLGLFQAVVLSLWLGSRAWGWVLAVPVIQVVGLLVSLVLWGSIASMLVAVGSGLWLIYLIRSGLLEEAYFAPQTERAPSDDELDLAAQILQERMSEAWDIQGRATVEDGQLKVEVGSLEDVDAASDLALQQGQAVIFKADGRLEDGSRLPGDAEVLLTGEDIETAQTADALSGDRPSLEIHLTEAGRLVLQRAWEKAAPLSLGLALDGEVVAAFEVETSDADGIYRIEPFSLDADYLAAILGNDPLPFPLKAVEVEDEEESSRD